MKTKVLMADDHVLFRDGMRYVLQQLAEKVEILEAGNFQDALQCAAENPDLDLVLLDLDMPGSEGVSSIELFHTRHPDIPVVVVSGSDQREDIEGVMGAGAMGFVSKVSSGRIMLSALRMVLEGGVYLPPQLLQQTVSRMDAGVPSRSRQAERAANFGLTHRQFEVLCCLSEGLSNKEIAKKLNLAEGTVKIHTAAVYQALRVNSRMEAVNVARRLGFLPSATSTQEEH